MTRAIAAALLIAAIAGPAAAGPRHPPERVCTYATFWACAAGDGE